jgi:hypothetical protein
MAADIHIAEGMSRKTLPEGSVVVIAAEYRAASQCKVT